MPRVKIDYVVSFSSEDPDHPANNLLLREVSKKKWLCKRGESSCSVVLQLPRTVRITGVHIGAYHAALVQVLVGRSETSSEQFQVLVPNSVFITREESRRDAPVVRVRSFSGDALSAAARAQRWDRVRVLCEQPHNKHAQFGLSFVHIDEAEGDAPAAVPPRMLALDTFSSDEDDFKPGELFAKHLQKTSGEIQSNISSNTGAQIRLATSQALKNINELSTKLMKTPISKPNVKRAHSPSTERSDRGRDTLLYTREDAAPPARLDRVLSRHQHDRGHDDSKPTKHEVTDNTNQNTENVSKTKDKSRTKYEPKRTPKRNQSVSPSRPQRHDDKPTSDQHKEKGVRSRRRSNSPEQPGTAVSSRVSGGGVDAPGPVSATPHTLLRGAVLVLSGYQHPRRAAVRDLALALGARVQTDWGPDCTHLICAFPNTPKLRAARSAPGALVPAARAAWLEHISRRRRLLPWRWFATEQKHLIQPKPEQLLDDDDAQPISRQTSQEPASDGDTDDEIEKVLQEQKRRRFHESNTSSDAHRRDNSPGATASDEPRAGACDTEDEGPTDEEAPGPAAPGPARVGALPHFFAGCTFVIDAAPPDARLLARYVRAYGGLALQMSEVGESSDVDYIVRGRGASGADERSVMSVTSERSVTSVTSARSVSAAWLARCHEAKACVPH